MILLAASILEIMDDETCGSVVSGSTVGLDESLDQFAIITQLWYKK
jgi:hypothetical protein